MRKLEKLSEGYGWIEKLTSKSIVEFLKAKDMLEEVHNKFFERYELSNTKFNVLLILHKEAKIYNGELYSL